VTRNHLPVGWPTVLQAASGSGSCSHTPRLHQSAVSINRSLQSHLINTVQGMLRVCWGSWLSCPMCCTFLCFKPFGQQADLGVCVLCFCILMRVVYRWWS
jgi:hypothetical protein